MRFARVIGSTTATVKDEALSSLKLLVVEPVDARGAPAGDSLVATDAVGAGPGDVVLVAQGSAARQSAPTRSLATDANVVAIIESVAVQGEQTYSASASTSPARTAQAEPSGR